MVVYSNDQVHQLQHYLLRLIHPIILSYFNIKNTCANF